VTTTEDKKRSSAVYAAAGIGDLAYQQLKKIPALADELRVKAESLREQSPAWRAQATDKAAQLAGKVDVDKIRTVLVANAQKAAEKAASFYGDLVTRGEKVVESEAPAATATVTAVAADKVADGAARVFDEAVKVSEDAAAKAEAATPKATPRKKAPGTAK
jgi:heparin binding hemagglutinin HbhA